MVEIAAALSMAGSAYNMIKNAVEKGQEVQDLYGVFSKFFDAKEQVAEAAIANSNPSLTSKLFSGKSVEAQALEVTAARHKMMQLEKELREFLIYTGQQQFYEDMMKERRVIRQQRIALAKKKAEQKALMIDLAIGGAAIILAVFVIAGLVVAVSS